MEHDGHTTEVAHEVEIEITTQETGFVDVVLLRLFIEPVSGCHFINDHIGTVDADIVRLPRIYHEQIRGLHGEVGHLTDMGRVGLGTSLYIIRLQVVQIDHLIIPDTIHAAYGELLVDTVDGGLDVFLTLIEIVLIDRTDGTLFQVGTTAQCEPCCQDIC